MQERTFLERDKSLLLLNSIMKNGGLDFDNQTQHPSCFKPPFRGKTDWKLVRLRE